MAVSAGPWQPLRVPVYRGLFVAQFASNVGTWMQVVGAQWLMGDLGGSPFAVALVQTAMTLPVFLAVVPAGVVGDLLDRRRVLLGAQATMGLVAGILAALTLTGQTTPGVLLAMTFVLGLGQALVVPSWQASMPDLVGRELVPQAATLNGGSMNVARAVGPAVGGALVALSGPGVVFALNALSFAATLFALGRWQRAPDVRALGPERFGAAIRAGGRYVRAAPALRRLMRRTFVFVLPAGALWSLLPVVARDELGLGSGGYGLLLGAVGAGALFGVVVLTSLRTRVQTATLIVGASLAYAAGLGVLAVSRDVGVVSCALVVLGVAWITVLSSMNAGAHALLPAWARARGLSWYQLTFMGGQALGAAVWGALAASVGSQAAFAAAAGLMLLGAIEALGRPPGSVSIDTSPSGHWPEPHVVLETAERHGPVLVSVSYVVHPDRAEAFREAMAPVGRSRRRTGAVRWSLWQDAADPRRFVETWELATWGEHLRQHAERVTVRDESYETTAYALLAEGTEPEVTHLLGVPLVSAHNPARRRWSAWPRRGRPRQA